MGIKPGQSVLDEATLVRWVREYASAIRGYITSLTRDAVWAEDLVQEVFLKAWRQREGYVDRGLEKAFLFRIADRLVIDQSRARRNEEIVVHEDVMDESSLLPIEQMIRDESADRLRQVLSQLSAVQQRVLLLRYYGELGFEEIASLVGCPLSTALSHARRGLEQMRVRLTKDLRVAQENE
jgi:RNA polymerase sigma-70 factor (ECF subfamily)